MNYEELQKLMREQKVEMTPKERMTAYNKGEEVDFNPYKLQGPDPCITNILGYKTSDFAKNYDVVEAVTRSRIDDYDLGGCNVSLGLRTVGAAYGSELSFPDNGFDHVTRYCVNDYSDLDKLEPITDPLNNPAYKVLYDRAAEIKRRIPEISVSTGVPGPISTAIAMRPIEKVLRDTVKDPDNLHRLMQYAVDGTLAWVRGYKERFGKASVGISDPVTCTTILSKKQFLKFSKPYLKQVIEGIEDIMGSTPGIHICGKTKAIWDDIVDLGIKGFSIDNVEDLAEAKASFGDKMQIIGNVPPVDVMMNGTIDDVIAAVIDNLRKCADNPCGYVINTGCQLSLGTPKQNLDAYIYAVRKYGRGARKGHLPKGLEDAC